MVSGNDLEFRVSKLTKLSQTAAQEYQNAMIDRVDYFSKEYSKDSIFNNFLENTVVKGLGSFLDMKVKVDEMLGENKEKVQNFLENIILFGI